MPRVSRTAAIIEQEMGKPIAEILPEIIHREGSVSAAASALGVTQGSVSLWLKIHGLRLVRTVKVVRVKQKRGA